MRRQVVSELPDPGQQRQLVRALDPQLGKIAQCETGPAQVEPPGSQCAANDRDDLPIDQRRRGQPLPCKAGSSQIA